MSTVRESLTDYPDLLAIYDAHSVEIASEIRALGFDEDQACRLYAVVVGRFSDGVKILAPNGGYVAAAAKARAMAYAAAWFCLTGNPRVQERSDVVRIAPVETNHWLAGKDQDAIVRDVERRFDIPAETFNELMTASTAALNYWCGAAAYLSGRVIGEPWCCPGCASQLDRNSSAQRRAAAAMLLGYCMSQEILDSLGREIARRQQPVIAEAADGKGGQPS